MIDPNIITTERVGELPINSISLTSKIPHEVGTVLSQATIQDLVNLLQPYIGTFQHEYKVLHVNSAFISDNFDSTGLGKNICLGWAIPNGQNGTTNIDGKVFVAYGSTYNIVGQTGGVTDVTLTTDQIPPHKHTVRGNNGVGSIGGADYPNGGGVLIDTSVTGGGLSHTNMQPYIVELVIIKL